MTIVMMVMTIVIASMTIVMASMTIVMSLACACVYRHEHRRVGCAGC